jgi:vancomycin resistance protein YoaR
MALSEQTIEQVRPRRLWRPALFALVFVLTALTGAALVLGGLAIFHEREAGRILPGVSVAGVDVGGSTPEEARAALAARLADVSAGGVVVRSGMGSVTLRFSDVGRTPDIDSMVADAAAIGRGGTWFDETLAAFRIRLHPESVGLRLGYDRERAAAAIRTWAARMTLGAIDAKVVVTPSTFAVIPSTDGWAVDPSPVIAAVDAVMRDPSSRAGATVTAAVRRIAPALPTDAAVAATAGAARMTAELKLTRGDRSWMLRASRIRRWITFGWVDGVYRPVLDRAAIPAWLDPIAKKVKRPVRDAEFLRDKGGRIVGSRADRAGLELDRNATATAIARAIEARMTTTVPPPASVKIKVATVAPARTTEEAAKRAPLMVMVGSWTTRYQSSPHNGFSANITVPTRVLNGTVVEPGAVFDFWARLGEVSLRTGYRLGGAIVGGHSVEGKALAGGICAASTTLFNAALRGGFDILQRQPHWYYITRYPLGLDATVSGTQTMRFRNDTRYPILIRGFASPGFVRYEIWSVPNGRTVSLSRPSVSNVVRGSDSVIPAPDLRKGTSERIEWPVDGKDVVVTRVVRNASGRIIHSDRFVSHYHRMIGINRIGTG